LLEPKNSQLTKPSKAQCHQIRTISKLRIQNKRVGNIAEKTMFALEAALKLHLDLKD
jgi:mRNA interferase MazF